MHQGFGRLLGQDPGWDTAKVLTGVFPMPEKRYDTPEKRLEFFRSVERRLGVLPGVEHVALATSLPLWHYGNVRQITSEALNGSWRLRARDRASIDTGYINSWSITF